MTRALRRVDLDFRGSRAAAPWLAWALLAVALAFVADLGVSYRDARQGIAKAEARLAALERNRGGGTARAAARNVTPEEIALARETFERLALPWSELFGALESAPAGMVTLTAIEPDTRAGTVVISGEGGSYNAVLEYVAGLQRAKQLDRVHLVRHEVRQGAEPQRAAAFSVSAAWSAANERRRNDAAHPSPPTPLPSGEGSVQAQLPAGQLHERQQ